MKRTQQTYQTYNIYQEVIYIDFLSPLEKLVFASLYNLLSKGKGKLEKGLMANSFSQILQQHYSVFGLKCKPVRREWEGAIENLVKLNMLEKRPDFKTQSEKFGKLIKVERPNYAIGLQGIRNIERAKQILKNQNINITNLF